MAFTADTEKEKAGNTEHSNKFFEKSKRNGEHEVLKQTHNYQLRPKAKCKIDTSTQALARRLKDALGHGVSTPKGIWDVAFHALALLAYAIDVPQTPHQNFTKLDILWVLTHDSPPNDGTLNLVWFAENENAPEFMLCKWVEDWWVDADGNEVIKNPEVMLANKYISIDKLINLQSEG